MALPEPTDGLEREERMVFLVETELMVLPDPEVCRDNQVRRDATVAPDERVRSDLLEILANLAETVMMDHADATERRVIAVEQVQLDLQDLLENRFAGQTTSLQTLRKELPVHRENVVSPDVMVSQENQEHQESLVCLVLQEWTASPEHQEHLAAMEKREISVCPDAAARRENAVWMDNPEDEVRLDQREKQAVQETTALFLDSQDLRVTRA